MKLKIKFTAFNCIFIIFDKEINYIFKYINELFNSAV